MTIYMPGDRVALDYLDPSEWLPSILDSFSHAEAEVVTTDTGSRRDGVPEMKVVLDDWRTLVVSPREVRMVKSAFTSLQERVEALEALVEFLMGCQDN